MQKMAQIVRGTALSRQSWDSNSGIWGKGSSVDLLPPLDPLFGVCIPPCFYYSILHPVSGLQLYFLAKF